MNRSSVLCAAPSCWRVPDCIAQGPGSKGPRAEPQTIPEALPVPEGVVEPPIDIIWEAASQSIRDTDSSWRVVRFLKKTYTEALKAAAAVPAPRAEAFVKRWVAKSIYRLAQSLGAHSETIHVSELKALFSALARLGAVPEFLGPRQLSQLCAVAEATVEYHCAQCFPGAVAAAPAAATALMPCFQDDVDAGAQRTQGGDFRAASWTWPSSGTAGNGIRPSAPNGDGIMPSLGRSPSNESTLAHEGRGIYVDPVRRSLSPVVLGRGPIGEGPGAYVCGSDSQPQASVSPAAGREPSMRARVAVIRRMLQVQEARNATVSSTAGEHMVVHQERRSAASPTPELPENHAGEAAVSSVGGHMAIPELDTERRHAASPTPELPENLADEDARHWECDRASRLSPASGSPRRCQHRSRGSRSRSHNRALSDSGTDVSWGQPASQHHGTQSAASVWQQAPSDSDMREAVPSQAVCGCCGCGAGDSMNPPKRLYRLADPDGRVLCAVCIKALKKGPSKLATTVSPCIVDPVPDNQNTASAVDMVATKQSTSSIAQTAHAMRIWHSERHVGSAPLGSHSRSRSHYDRSGSHRISHRMPLRRYSSGHQAQSGRRRRRHPHRRRSASR